MKMIYRIVVAGILLLAAWAPSIAAQTPIQLSSDRFVKQDVSDRAQEQLLAQLNMLTGAGGKFKAGGGAPPSYVGPGDVSGWSGAYAHYGLRAYTAALAATQNALIRVATNDAGANGTDIHSQTNGQINLTEIATFKSTYGATTIYVSTIYDQSGNGRHLSTTSTFELPQLAENAIATTLPAFSLAPSRLISTASNNTAQAQPITLAYVAKFNGDGAVISDGSFGWILGRSFAGARRISAGSNENFDVTTDGTWESGQAVYKGAPSTFRLNGTDITGTGFGDPGTGGISNTVPMTLGAGPAAFYLNPGLIFEVTIMGSEVSGANQAALYSNQQAAGLVP